MGERGGKPVERIESVTLPGADSLVRETAGRIANHRWAAAVGRREEAR